MAPGPVTMKAAAEKAAGRVVALVNDLFFSVKISGAAKEAGVEVVFVKDGGSAVGALERTRLVILDLNDAQARPLDVVQEIRRVGCASRPYVLGFLSHVQTDLRAKAKEAGCDAVLARSAFSEKLTEILKSGGLTEAAPTPLH